MAGAAQGERLQKVLARAGFGSRREIEEWIRQGRVSVNSRPAVLGARVKPGDTVRLDGRTLRVSPAQEVRALLYHKPAGQIVSRRDPEGRPSVFEHLPPVRRGRWVPVGRLDYNTEGLLILTTSGELAHRLMHPRYAMAREYAVRVRGAFTEEEKQRLLSGVRLEDGMARIEVLEEAGGSGSNVWYRMTLREGRNREVRRLVAAVGHEVSRLIRTRFGPVALPSDLKRGRWRELAPEAVEALLRAVGLPAPSPRADAGKKKPASPRASQPAASPGRRERFRPDGRRTAGRGSRPPRLRS
jgi:23S rRNA pseudouridine2605 synthase